MSLHLSLPQINLSRNSGENLFFKYEALFACPRSSTASGKRYFVRQPAASPFNKIKTHPVDNVELMRP
jgi:hypothetical protein